jgi:hypothetical protein
LIAGIEPPDVGVLAQIADQNDFVDAARHDALLAAALKAERGLPIRPLVDAVGDRVCRAQRARLQKAHAYPHLAASNAWEAAMLSLH